MSENKSMFDKILNKKDDIESFSDNKGSDASEHAKKIAKEKSNKKPSGEEYYTIREGKILKVIIKHNGAYTTYVGSKKNMTDDQFKKAIKSYGDKWIGEYDYEDKSKELIAKLQSSIKKNSIGKAK